MNDSSAPLSSLDDLLEKVKNISSTYVVNADTVTLSTDNNSTAGSITSIDLNTIGNITIGGTMSSGYSYTVPNTINTISIGSGIGISPLTSDQINSFTFQMPVEWQDKFPEWDKVKKMCEEYPGLKIAFEKFQTTYKLVVDHYDTPEDKRPKP